MCLCDINHIGNLMEQHFFTLSLIEEGATENVLQYTMLLKSVFNKIFCFNEQNSIFEHSRKVFKTIKNL